MANVTFLGTGLMGAALAEAAAKRGDRAMIIAITAGLADVYTMAVSMGIEARDAHGLFGKFNPAGVIGYRGAAMSKGNYEASFELAMARKDVRLMVDAAAGRELTLLPRIADRMDRLIERGFGADDMGVLAIDAVPRSARS
jgi:3-hydroxyisobutyrate dehydrogenase